MVRFRKGDGDVGVVTHLTLQLRITAGDEGRKVVDSTVVHDNLRKLWGVLCDVGEGRGGDSLESKLGLLHAEDEVVGSFVVDNGLWVGWSGVSRCIMRVRRTEVWQHALQCGLEINF